MTILSGKKLRAIVNETQGVIKCQRRCHLGDDRWITYHTRTQEQVGDLRIYGRQFIAMVEGIRVDEVEETQGT